MNRKTHLILIGLALIVSAGLAQAGGQVYDQVLCELEPTLLGMDMDASGIAAKTFRNGIETLDVKVAAQVEDGTILIVSGIRNDGMKFDLGAIEMMLDSGDLKLNSETDPSEAFPLDELAAIKVYHRRGLVLKGVFAR